MNERIKQLADQAAKYSAIMALPTGQSGNELFVEKFAELIVQECIDVHVDDYGVDIIGDVLKEHFGVEE